MNTMNTVIYHVTGDLMRDLPSYGVTAGFARVEFYVAPADLQHATDDEIRDWARNLVENAFQTLGQEGDDLKITIDRGEIEIPMPEGVSVTIPDSMG